MNNKFNNYCASVVYPEAELRVSAYDCNLCFPRKEGETYPSIIHDYNPFDDLDQMVKIVEKLAEERNTTMQLIIHRKFGEKWDIKRAFRDFIISTIPEEE